jgi:hypothetical protein
LTLRREFIAGDLENAEKFAENLYKIGAPRVKSGWQDENPKIVDSLS